MRMSPFSKALSAAISLETDPVTNGPITGLKPEDINGFRSLLDTASGKEIGVAGTFQGDERQVVLNNGLKQAWYDSMVKHDEFGDEMSAAEFIDGTVVADWEEEEGWVVGTVGIEHNPRKPGWGGRSEFLGAFALAPADPKLPQYEWRQTETASILTLKLPGISTLFDVELNVEEEGLEVHLGEEDSSESEGEAGNAAAAGSKGLDYTAKWRFHPDACIDPAARPKPKFVGDPSLATVQCSFRRATPDHIDQVKEHLREAAEHARMIAAPHRAGE